jgi:hypothetical protein
MTHTTKSSDRDMNDWTKGELLALPHRPWQDGAGYHSILILNTTKLHDSGYRGIILIGCKRYVPTEIITSMSDDVEIRPGLMDTPGLGLSTVRMDCLKRSGAFRLWSWDEDREFYVGHALSSVTIEHRKKG